MSRSRSHRTLLLILAVATLGVLIGTGKLQAAEPDQLDADRWTVFRDVLLLRDYNTRMVAIGTSLLGLTAGVIGTFLLLRKRSLAGDVVGHASLPGIGIAFLIMEGIAPGQGRSVPGLLAGALAGGTTGVLLSLAIRRSTRIKEDAAYAIILSIFFGVGVALFTVIQSIPTGNAAGLEQFIFGKAASLRLADVKLIVGGSIVVLAVCLLLFKEFSLLCFDEEFAAAEGWPTLLLDVVLMALVVGVSVIGLQSVGLLLVVALLITPAAAARFWTHNLSTMVVVAATIGTVSAFAGVAISATFPKLAAGAVIVLAGSVCFLVSLLAGTERGVVRKWLERRRTTDDIERRLLAERSGWPGPGGRP